MIYTSPPPTKIGTHFESLCQDGITHHHDGTISETTIKTVTVPAGLLLANGALRMRVVGRTSGNNGIKTIRIRFGGNELNNLQTIAAVSAQFFEIDVILYNANSVSAQAGHWRPIIRDALGLFDSVISSSINTANAADITITAQLANISDDAYITGVLIEAASQQ